jgi:hypothetical protein
MTATIQWLVTNMECYAQEGGNTDVVFLVTWICKGTQEVNGEIFGAQDNGITQIPAPTDSFTPYDQLTQEQVLGWVWANGVDQTFIESDVQAKVAAKIAPVTVIPPLPWATQPSAPAA